MPPVICNLATDTAGSPGNNNTCRDNTTTAANFCSDFGSVLGGVPNSMVMTSELSTIVMGDANQINCSTGFGLHNSILNGRENVVHAGTYNTII